MGLRYYGFAALCCAALWVCGSMGFGHYGFAALWVCGTMDLRLYGVRHYLLVILSSLGYITLSNSIVPKFLASAFQVDMWNLWFGRVVLTSVVEVQTDYA